MARGPLPSPNARRRNAPSIPSTLLPAVGRAGKAPRVPAAYALGKAGKAWWSWAWKLPQACGWSDGDLYVLARRASLEDDLATLELVDHFDLGALLEIEDTGERGRELEHVIGHLKRLAGGSLAVMKEMRELDSRLGLTPKALADLRWSIQHVDVPAGEGPATPPARRHLRAVDPATEQTA